VVEIEKKNSVLELTSVKIYPIKCEAFQMNLIDSETEEFQWVVQTITKLSEKLNTMIKSNIINSVEQDEDIVDCFANSPEVEVTVELT
jgi:hypothetical protein